MRSALVLLLLTVAVAARDDVRLTEEQRSALVRIVGEETWLALPHWRQGMVVERYLKYLRAPERRQEVVRQKGLREFLLFQTPPRRDKPRLPGPLEKQVNRLPPQLRPLAAKAAFLRLRQLQLDRALLHVPPEKRWEVFDRRFPSKYSSDAARHGHDELKRYLVKSFAAKVARRLEQEGAEMGPEEREQLLRRMVAEEERRIVERIERELFRFRDDDPRRIKAHLERRAFFLLERLPGVNPRQRELIRYALRPHECPLLDLSFLGPRPEEAEARRTWERDRMVFGRMELLLEAGFNREMVLYLAGTGSPEDFFRAAQRLRGAYAPK